ncbi:PIN domain-containing protein [Fluoribacter dumoffii]|uniref:PIN domain-containing protein n=1 Tax=Fluoribacter dumoffii TaxID=463 RepID=UPI00224367E9|nr:PIN domain-containing protein [Fluoribacter dumoffii]MCW8483183.1 PIN domain-containing protein [Fluoribacter dumoffii]
MVLKTKNVFIDTQSFVMAELNFNSRTFSHFASLCNKTELTHITTTIIVREIQDKIHKQIEESIAAFNKFKRKAKFLENTNNEDLNVLFKTIDEEQIKKHAIKIFDEFLTHSKSNILTLEKINPELAFNLYFNKFPPFQEGKKKSEFPDAFNLLALDEFLSPKELIYIISKDTDVIAFCQGKPQFEVVETLNKFLDIYNTHREVLLSELIKNYVKQNSISIEERIKTLFEESDVYNESSWENSEVENFHVVKIDELELDIISIDEKQCLCSSTIEVTYNVTVIGPDFINGTYDRESGKMYTFDDTVREEEGVLNATVEIEIDYEITNDLLEINNLNIVVLELRNGIAVCVEESELDY